MARLSIAAVDAEAARGDLGGRRAIHAERRVVELPVLAAVVGLALLFASRAAFAHSALIAAGLVPSVMLAVLGYRYLPPVGGARTVAVYERGFVEASGKGLRTVHWDDVSDVDTTASPAARASWSTGLARRRELTVEIDREVQPRVLAKARALLGDAGEVRFGPLVVTRDGVGQAGTHNALFWSQLISHRRTGGDRLLILHTPTSSHTEPGIWFDQPVPNAITADRLIDELDPNTDAADAASLVASDLKAESRAARHWHALGRGAVAGLAVVSIVPALLLPTYDHRPIGHGSGNGSTPLVIGSNGPSDLTLPLGFSGYESVCDGSSFQGAAPYTGAGPHPIVFVGNYPNLGGKFADEPESWQTTDLSRVQLVACVVVTNGPVAATCAFGSYNGPQTVTETIYYADYTITIHQAKTGARVGGPIRMRGEDATCPNSAPAGSPSPTSGLFFTGEQIQQALGDVVERSTPPRLSPR